MLTKTLSANIPSAIAALADPTRRGIYEALGASPRSVGDIARGMPVSRPAVSQHLRVLREAGLVVETRAGTRHLFTANAATALELRDYFQSMWERALASYTRHVHQKEDAREHLSRRR